MQYLYQQKCNRYYKTDVNNNIFTETIIHTMITVQRTIFLPTKPLWDDDSGVRHSFGTKISLWLIKSTPVVSQDTTNLCWFIVTLWQYHIHIDEVRTLFWIIIYIYICLFNGENPKLVRDGEVGIETAAPNFNKIHIFYPAISDT